MTWSQLLRVAKRPGSTRRHVSAGRIGAEEAHRHPAMSGLNVSPVHGRHCICDRCARAARG